MNFSKIEQHLVSEILKKLGAEEGDKNLKDKAKKALKDNIIDKDEYALIEVYFSEETSVEDNPETEEFAGKDDSKDDGSLADLDEKVPYQRTAIHINGEGLGATYQKGGKLTALPSMKKVSKIVEPLIKGKLEYWLGPFGYSDITVIIKDADKNKTLVNKLITDLKKAFPESSKPIANEFFEGDTSKSIAVYHIPPRKTIAESLDTLEEFSSEEDEDSIELEARTPEDAEFAVTRVGQRDYSSTELLTIMKNHIMEDPDITSINLDRDKRVLKIFLRNKLLIVITVYPNYISIIKGTKSPDPVKIIYAKDYNFRKPLSKPSIDSFLQSLKEFAQGKQVNNFSADSDWNKVTVDSMVDFLLTLIEDYKIPPQVATKTEVEKMKREKLIELLKLRGYVPSDVADFSRQPNYQKHTEEVVKKLKKEGKSNKEIAKILSVEIGGSWDEKIVEQILKDINFSSTSSDPKIESLEKEIEVLENQINSVKRYDPSEAKELKEALEEKKEELKSLKEKANFSDFFEDMISAPAQNFSMHEEQEIPDLYEELLAEPKLFSFFKS